MRDFANDVVVITGAGSGIGRALAKEFAAGGAELALADVNAAAVEETRSLLGNAKAGIYVCDVGDAAAVEAFAR